MKTFYSFSFGCRVNQAEKEALDQQLVQRGYTFTDNNPTLYILNTCSVTHKAEREAKQHIYQTRKQFPNTTIVVTGCAATNWLKTKTAVEEIDLLIDNQNKEYIAEILEKRLLDSVPEKEERLNLTIKQDKYLPSRRAIIKIQDGCHRFCSFCIVPYLRGLPKSIPIDEIIHRIAHFGPDLQEVILTAINTEAYGYDTKKEKFIDLVQAILNQTTIPRISFGSIHPWTLTDDFFQFYQKYATSNRLVHFFHIPLQSGANRTLQLMKRGYTREEFIEKLNRLHELNPFAFIGTDVIVGFLEETDQDFAQTYDFLEKSPISRFHVFRFSKRQHTAAFHLSKRLSEPSAEKKKERSNALLELSKRKYEQFLQKHIGETFDALFLEKREGEWQHALLSNQVPVVIHTPTNLTGMIQPVRLIEYKNGTLFGRIG